MLKSIIISSISVILLLSEATLLFAQKYPDRPITLVIPMAPGDGLDIAARLMGEELSKLLKIPIVPLNKPGAGATVGTDLVVKAKKDGYTLLFTNSASTVIARVLQPETVPYDPEKDLTPLGMSAVWPMVVVSRSSNPYNHFKEMVEYGRKNPGKIRCGMAGVMSISDFNVRMLKSLTGLEMTVVPFKGASPAVTAILGGHVDVVCVSLTMFLSHLRSGEVKGMVVSKSFPEFPEIPTLEQLGYKQDLIHVWATFYAPAGVPSEVKEALVPAIEKVVREPSLSTKLAEMGIYQGYESPQSLAVKIRDESRMIEEMAKKFGMIK